MTSADTPWSAIIQPLSTIAVPMHGDKPFDVCVVGAGIAGLTTALLAARAGQTVLVLEAREVGHGETARSSAHLFYALDDRFLRLERLHGRRATRLAAESHAAAVDFIERLVHERHIECDFARVDGYLISAAGHRDDLLAELAATQRAGVEAEMVENVPGLPAWTGPAIRFPRQGRIDPAAYLQGLWQCCSELNVTCRQSARVVRISDGEPVAIELADGEVIRAAAVVVATNVPMNDRVLLHTKLEAYRTYAMAFRVPDQSVADLLLWDDLDPYHYVRLAHDADGDLLIVGGEDHKTGQGPHQIGLPHAHLEAWTRERFPQAGKVVHAWSGQIIEPVDGLAYIGPNPTERHVYVITGDSGHGLTHGTLGGMLVVDELRGRANAWSEVYRPSRVTIGSVAEYVGHNVNVLRQYADWLATGDYARVEDIPRGSGGIVRLGITPHAVHRRADGQVMRCSAICPHLGGLVRWNEQESTWDCPCHGSRFSRTGAVLNGPAVVGLTVIEEVEGLPPGALPVA